MSYIMWYIFMIFITLPFILLFDIVMRFSDFVHWIHLLLYSCFIWYHQYIFSILGRCITLHLFDCFNGSKQHCILLYSPDLTYYILSIEYIIYCCIYIIFCLFFDYIFLRYIYINISCKYLESHFRIKKRIL